MVSLMSEGFEPLKSDEDVEEILRLAVRGTTADRGSLRDRLKMSAEELGIPADALAEAEKEWLLRKRSEADRLDEALDRKLFKKIQVGEFISHLGAYLAINGFLFWLDFRKGNDIDWAIWPILGWGIAIVIHLFKLFGTDKETDREFQRWRKKRRKQLRSDD